MNPIYDIENIYLKSQIDTIQTEISNGSGDNTGYSLRQINIIGENGPVGGSEIYSYSNGSVIYSYNQSPGQLVIDSGSVEVGTEFIVVTGNNNSVYFETFSETILLQISGSTYNTDPVKKVNMSANCKCTLTKVTSNLWIIQGDDLSYSS